MNFLSEVKYGVTELFSGIFKPTNYFTDPVYVSIVYSIFILLILFFGMPLLIVAFYGIAIAINNATSLTEEEMTELIKAPLSVEEKTELTNAPLSVEECIAIANKYTPSQSIETEEDRMLRLLPDVPLPVIEVPTVKAGELLFELLFRNQPTRIVSAINEKNAVEVSNLSIAERNDLLGISRL